MTRSHARKLGATYSFTNSHGHTYYGRVVGVNSRHFLPMCDDGTWMADPIAIPPGLRSLDPQYDPEIVNGIDCDGRVFGR